MAVQIRKPIIEEPVDLKAYLRMAAEQELSTLTPQSNHNMIKEEPINQIDQTDQTDQTNQSSLNRYDSNSFSTNQTSSNFTSPLLEKYRISQAFGNYNPGLYKGVTKDSRHYGLDVATPEGTQVKSPFAGIARVVKNDKDFGNFVEIKTKDGQLMRFSHLKSIDDLIMKLGAMGNEIQAGQNIGLTGSTGRSTGAHLDIMYKRGNQWVNPLEFEPLKRTLG